MAAPAVGSVIDGYRFMGGNPNDQKAWKRMDLGDPKATAAQAPRNALAINTDEFRRGRDTLNSIEDAKRRSGFWTTGPVGSVLGMIPSTPAYNLNQDLNPIRARNVLQEMSQMRLGSAAGATGLGAMDKGERQMLEGAEGSLDIGQGAKQLDRNLDRVAAATASRIAGLTPENPIKYTSQDQFEAIPVGAFFKDPAGKVWKKAAPGTTKKGSEPAAMSDAALKAALGL